MESSNLTPYYLGLLTVQVTILTLVAAGVIALYQIHDKQTPKRDFGKVVNPKLLIAYFSSALTLILITAILTWSSSGTHNVLTFVNFHLGTISTNDFSRLIIMGFTLVICFIFFFFLWKSRTLLDTKRYLERLSHFVKSDQMSDYLFHTYSSKPFPYVHIMSFALGIKKISKKKEAEARLKSKNSEKDWQKRYDMTTNTVNPLSPFVDYCRNNAVNASGDVETVGLPTLERLIIDYANSDVADTVYIPNFISDINNEIKEAFATSSLAVKKRYLDLLRNVAVEYCRKKKFSQMINVTSKIHLFVKGNQDEDLKQYAVRQIREITDEYVTINGKEKDWRKFDSEHQELALVVARIAEDHYHNISDLTPVSIIENNRTEIDDLNGEIVNYFAAYEDLHEKYPEIIPVIFFDAVDVSAEALINAVNRSNVIKNDIGLSTSRYEQNIGTLYYIFYSYAKAGIESNNADLVKLAVYRLTRGLKFMHDKKVEDCALDVADTLVSLGIRIACTPEIKDARSFGGTPILDVIVESINLYADHDKLAARKSSIEHTLFEFVLKPESIAFERRLIGW